MIPKGTNFMLRVAQNLLSHLELQESNHLELLEKFAI